MKAQISAEFMFYISILLIIMSFATFFAIVTGNDLRTESINTDAKRLAAAVATEINTAVEVGDGYSRNFFLPQTVYGSINYTIDILYQRVYIYWEGRSYSLPVLAYNITGSPAKGYTTIRNSNGVIVFV